MTFEFDDQQTQYIVNTLAARPYGEVFELMGSIQRQAATQQQQRLQSVPTPTIPDPQTGT
jgi:hypothetical protein